MKFSTLHALRGLAALYVLIAHSRTLLWEGFPEFFADPSRYNPLQASLVWASDIFRFGHEVVILFFVLSGFLIHLRYSQDLAHDPAQAKLKLGRFYIKRLVRIYPTLLFAIVLTALLDQIGMFKGYGIYYGNSGYTHIDVSVDYGARIFLRNILLIPTTPEWGTNGPLWSLQFEWWFYMIFPLFWLLLKRSTRLATLVVMLLFTFALLPAVTLPQTIRMFLLYFPMWWMGVLLAEIHARRTFIKLSMLKYALLFPVLLPLVSASEVAKDFIWSVTFMGLLAFLITTLENSRFVLGLSAKFQLLGDISYPLYITHYPLLVLLSGWLLSRRGSLPIHFGWAAVGVFLCLVLAYIVHVHIEKRFWAVELPKKQADPQAV